MRNTSKLYALATVSAMIAVSTAFAQAPRQTIEVTQEQLEAYPEGKYDATWESLESNYSVPEWFKDAKFGIFIHWGPYTVPAAGSEWYPKHMYNGISKAHREKWGPQNEFGYKDFIPLFKAEKFNADEWAELFKASGAQYVIPTAEHHDGFAMYDSDLTEWTSVKHGPKRDVIGELSKAVRDKGMRFGISNHRVENWDFMYPSLDPDSTDLFDPQYASLYGPPQKPTENSGMGPSEEHPGPHPQNDAFMNEWQYRVMEIIDKYQPDLIYFDNGINYRSMDPWKLNIARYYYNSADKWGKEVSLQSKSDAYKAGSIRDFERESRAPKEKTSYYWQVDDPIGHKFGYVEGLKLQNADGIIRSLINNISRNGNLCLNVSPKSDGTIPDDQKKELYAVGKWLSKYGEAVYGTRAFGENKDGDVRYTSKGRRNLYAFLLKWDGKSAELPGIKASDIEEISMIGGGKLKWNDKDGKVFVETVTPADDGPATVIKIKLKSDLTALFIGDSITDGGWGRSAGKALPSSNRNKTDQNHNLGHSYVMLSAAKMMAEDPTLKCNWLNRGISGNTIKELKKRWKEDVIEEDPDVLTVMVGINDVYKYYRDGGTEEFDVNNWTADFRDILTLAKDANPTVKIILMSPFVAEGRAVDSNIYPQVKKSIDQCADSVKKLAKDFGAEYIDTNNLFNSLTSGNSNSKRWLWDGIHPTPAGHQLIANLWTEKAKKKKLIF
ncbi:MAG: alpha-L-fucosidase [Muribaculaceae bacterium]|nr:alpha-L-fucosidase [Muribaculaceae bacterium]